MDIRTFAERVLFGTTWEDKLIRLNGFEDPDPGTPLTTPPYPGRPEGLRLDSWHDREQLRFSDVRRLHTKKERGLVLHFFANHELLALELMALALLKFPDAPAKFRRGLAQTLVDEQEHVRLYRRRMEQVGVEFGEIPVSDFFWTAIAPMERPMDFVARLSLTLEQANLDYAVYYARTYRRLGDEETADILQRIYQDEIGHVKHGLSWFNRWRDPGLSEWEAYKRVLNMPLSPARAKGIGFNREGRSQAGFSARYIDELELFSQSRGRCPTVFWFDPNCETRAAYEGTEFTPAKQLRQLMTDFAELPMLLCAADDVVLVAQRPSTPFLHEIHGAGFAIPEFVEYGADGLQSVALAARKIRRLTPWGWSCESARFLAPLMPNLTADNRRQAEDFWNGQIRALYSKSFSVALLRRVLPELREGRDWLCRAREIGEVFSDRDQLTDQIEAWAKEGCDEVVVKAAFGAAGREQIFVSAGRLRDEQIGWVTNTLAQQGTVVAEPRLSKRFDLSVHLDVGEDGMVNLVGWTRFLTDGRGQFIGAFATRIWSGLSAEDRRFVYGDGRMPQRLPDLFAALADLVGEALFAQGYVGPVGIDALVYEDGPTLRLKPIVEINPRLTMGRVALSLRRRVKAARTSVWVTLTRREIEAAGFAGMREYHAFVLDRHPVEMQDGLISRGLLLTTDLSKAEMFCSALVVGESLEQCGEYLGPLSGKLEPAFV